MSSYALLRSQPTQPTMEQLEEALVGEYSATDGSSSSRSSRIGQTVGSISSRTLAYDCLCTLELCTASMIATS